MTDWKQRPISPNCVTIFGAGVAGLTAAHELVERGFRVQIWEKVGDPRYPHRGPDIGGLARTQWSRINWRSGQELDRRPEVADDLETRAPQRPPTVSSERAAAFEARKANPIVLLQQKLVFERKDAEGRPWLLAELLHSVDEEVNSQRRSWSPSATTNPVEHLRELMTNKENYFILRVRGYEQVASKEQKVLLDRVVSAFGQALGCKVSRAPDSADLIFEGFAESKEIKLTVRSAGNEFFSADTYARIDYYVGSDFQPTPSYFALQREWELGESFALGDDGEHDSGKVLAQFARALRDNPQINYVYVESSDRDAQWLNSEELWRRAEKVRARLQDRLSPLGFALEIPPAVEEASSKNDSGPQSVPFVCTLVDKGSTTATESEAPAHESAPTLGRKIFFEIVLLREFPSDVPPNAHIYTAFRVRERWLPGEHGYRLFPNCYRHLFDTMKRTPLLDAITKSPFGLEQERAAGVAEPAPLRYVETGRTTFDNILPTSKHLLAFEHGAGPSVLSRSKIRSIDELRQLTHVIFAPVEDGGFEVDGGDAVRLSLKMLKYITSSPARRESYESLSWWDFVDGDSYGKRLGNFLEVWPEALVAMDAHSADARSHGDSLIQVTLDQLRDGGFRDGTLRGPVSEAWFTHWRRYLEAQGVEFLHGELTGFEVKKVQTADALLNVVLPDVSCFEPRYPMDDDGKPLLMPGYFVVAVSADQAATLGRQYRETVGATQRAPDAISDFTKAGAFEDWGLDEAEPKSDFRHFAGLQFYFAEDIFWAQGHVYYPESPWGLSSVSQARFWNEKTDWEHGFRGILSVIVATWNVPGELTGRCAWNCSPSELAAEVWHQIKRGVERLSNEPKRDAASSQLPSERYTAARFRVDERLVDNQLPEPLHWRLDENLEWLAESKHYRNHAPFHIARPGKYRDRPGSLDAEGYLVENGFVMCGMHTQTYFRLPTMEAANESARHAVNAILKHANSGEAQAVRRTLCETWEPEMFEFDSLLVDLQSLKDLDHKLKQRGLPHVMDILETDKLASAMIDGVTRWDIKQIVRILLDLSRTIGAEVAHG